MEEKRNEFLKFALIVFVTIIVTRLIVLVFPDKSWYLFGQEIHHFFHGVVLVLISALSRFFSKNKKIHKLDIYLFGIGTGLIFDEFAFVLFDVDNINYFSSFSIYGIFVSIFVFIVIYYLLFLSLLFIYNKLKKK